ncbi:MAG: helix-hairpin-helix domain-containing protein, partial [Pyrinomonadaceae bacterium]
YFSTCKMPIKLLPLIISSFWFGCSEQKEAKQVLLTGNQVLVSESAININTASLEELEKLPHVGAKLAQNIIEHREKFGKFRKAEFLMLVDGISDNRFREIRNSVKVE